MHALIYCSLSQASRMGQVRNRNASMPIRENSSKSSTAPIWWSPSLSSSAQRSIKKLSSRLPGLLSINHPPSEILVSDGAWAGSVFVVFAITGAGVLDFVRVSLAVAGTEPEFPFRYKLNKEVFIWFADWKTKYLEKSQKDIALVASTIKMIYNCFSA